MKFIEGFVMPPQIPLAINCINEELNKAFELKCRKRYIKLYLKNWINYSYKKALLHLREEPLNSIFAVNIFF